MGVERSRPGDPHDGRERRDQALSGAHSRSNLGGRQCVQFGPEQDRGAAAIGQDAHHCGAADADLDREAIFLQFPGDAPGGAVLGAGQFGMGVQILIEGLLASLGDAGFGPGIHAPVEIPGWCPGLPWPEAVLVQHCCHLGPSEAALQPTRWALPAMFGRPPGTAGPGRARRR